MADLFFSRAKQMKFITNKISTAGGMKKMFTRTVYPEARTREGFEELGACLWFVPKAADSFPSCLTSKRSRRITRLNRNWIIRQDEINALPWHFRSGRDTRDWLVFRPYICTVCATFRFIGGAIAKAIPGYRNLSLARNPPCIISSYTWPVPVRESRKIHGSRRRACSRFSGN